MLASVVSLLWGKPSNWDIPNPNLGVSPSNVLRKHLKKFPNIFGGHLKFINIPLRK